MSPHRRSPGSLAPGAASLPSSDALTEFAQELTRVVDRLRAMPLGQLERPWNGFASRAAGVRALAQWCVDHTALPPGVSSAQIPDVGPLAVGDQLAVTATDLLSAPATADAVAAATSRFRELRLTL